MILLLGPVLIIYSSEVEPMPFVNNLIKMTNICLVADKTVNINKAKNHEMQSLLLETRIISWTEADKQIFRKEFSAVTVELTSYES